MREIKEITLCVNKGNYPQEVIESVLYRNADTFYGKIYSKNDTDLCVNLGHRNSKSEESLEVLREIFLICLNEERLKVRVAQRTSQLRDLILAHAFSKAVLNDQSCQKENR